MKKLLIILSFFCVTLAFAQTDIAAKIQNLSVTIDAGKVSGSGSVITRDKINFIITAGHVVEANRKVVRVLKNGMVQYITKFSPVIVTREIYVEGKSVGKVEVQADVIAYSSADYGHDLALLKLRSPITIDSIKFTKENISVGTELLHCGSLLGQEGSNSITMGVLSQIGRTIDDYLYDQTSCATFAGSSGGGIFLKSNGEQIGVITRHSGENFSYFIPVRRIKEWSKNHHIEFIWDENLKIDLNKIQLECNEHIADSDLSNVNK